MNLWPHRHSDYALCHVSNSLSSDVNLTVKICGEQGNDYKSLEIVRF
jgi:hypothetical protein